MNKDTQNQRPYNWSERKTELDDITSVATPSVLEPAHFKAHVPFAQETCLA